MYVCYLYSHYISWALDDHLLVFISHMHQIVTSINQCDRSIDETKNGHNLPKYLVVKVCELVLYLYSCGMLHCKIHIIVQWVSFHIVFHQYFIHWPLSKNSHHRVWLYTVTITNTVFAHFFLLGEKWVSCKFTINTIFDI